MSQELLNGSSSTILPVAAAAALLAQSAPALKRSASGLIAFARSPSLQSLGSSAHEEAGHHFHPIKDQIKAWWSFLVAKTEAPCCPSHHSTAECASHRSEVAQIKLQRAHSSFKLWETAEVVTLEAKFHVLPWIAEFWCTITSIFFALPASVYLIPLIPSSWFVQASMSVAALVPSAPVGLSGLLTLAASLLEACSTFQLSQVSSFAHGYILLTCVVAACSTIYHATLWNVFSVLDVVLATVAFWVNTTHLLQASLEFEPISWSLCISTIIISTIIFRFESHAEIAVWAFALGVPFAIWGYASIHCLSGAVIGGLGLACFLMDRNKLMMSHSLWHILGGISMACGVFSLEVLQKHNNAMMMTH